MTLIESIYHGLSFVNLFIGAFLLIVIANTSISPSDIKLKQRYKIEFDREISVLYIIYFFILLCICALVLVDYILLKNSLYHQ